MTKINGVTLDALHQHAKDHLDAGDVRSAHQIINQECDDPECSQVRGAAVPRPGTAAPAPRRLPQLHGGPMSLRSGLTNEESEGLRFFKGLGGIPATSVVGGIAQPPEGRGADALSIADASFSFRG